MLIKQIVYLRCHLLIMDRYGQATFEADTP